MEYLYLYRDELAFNGAGGLIVESVDTPCDYLREKSREYLEGKCVKIESPEHSEFVQKLAFNAGFVWNSTGESEYLPVKDGYIHFSGVAMIRNYTTALSELTTIPLPPKAEPKEWPQVGDSVIWGKGADNAEIKALDDYSAWVKNIHGNYYTVDINKLRKPKTEAEILRDDLEYTIHEFEGDKRAGADYLLSKYNITKKV